MPDSFVHNLGIDDGDGDYDDCNGDGDENLSGYLLCQLEALAMPERASKFTARKITHTPTEARHLIYVFTRDI